MMLHYKKESETHFVNDWGLYLFYCKKLSLSKEARKSKKYNKKKANKKVEGYTNLQSKSSFKWHCLACDNSHVSLK